MAHRATHECALSVTRATVESTTAQTSLNKRYAFEAVFSVATQVTKILFGSHGKESTSKFEFQIATKWIW